MSPHEKSPIQFNVFVNDLPRKETKVPAGAAISISAHRNGNPEAVSNYEITWRYYYNQKEISPTDLSKYTAAPVLHTQTFRGPVGIDLKDDTRGMIEVVAEIEGQEDERWAFPIDPELVEAPVDPLQSLAAISALKDEVRSGFNRLEELFKATKN